MTPSDRPISMHRLSRRGFGRLLPWGGVAALAACSRNPEPAAPAAADPAPMPAPPSTVTSDAAASGPASGSAATSGAAGAGLPMVDPADSSAKALAYMADASQPVAAGSAKHPPGQACSNCALFAGKPGDAAGLCPLYVGKRVSAIAWCNAYARKVG
jgi:hypothetical protein